MSQSLMFAKHADWKKTKSGFMTIALCAVASLKRSEVAGDPSAFAFKVSHTAENS